MKRLFILTIISLFIFTGCGNNNFWASMTEVLKGNATSKEGAKPDMFRYYRHGPDFTAEDMAEVLKLDLENIVKIDPDKEIQAMLSFDELTSSSLIINLLVPLNIDIERYNYEAAGIWRFATSDKTFLKTFFEKEYKDILEFSKEILNNMQAELESLTIDDAVQSPESLTPISVEYAIYELVS